MSALFDRLTSMTGEMAENPPEPDWELHSERELTCTDTQELVTVVMKDFAVDSLRIDHLWYEKAELEQVEARVREAVNVGFAEYLKAELLEATEVNPNMKAVHAEMLELSADFNASFTRQMEQITERMR